MPKFTLTMLDNNKEPVREVLAKSFNEMTDVCSDVAMNDIDVAFITVNDGRTTQVVDLWKMRDRAALDGYELPVHRQMLRAKGIA